MSSQSSEATSEGRETGPQQRRSVPAPAYDIALTRALKRRLLMGLLLLVTLVTGGYLLQEQQRLIAARDAHLLNLAGRQRMLLNGIAHQAALLTHPERPDAVRRSATRRLAAHADQMAREYAQLHDPSRRFTATPELHQIYFDGPESLDATLTRLLQMAKQVGAEPSPPADVPQLAILAHEIPPAVERVDQAVERYAAVAERHIVSLARLDLAVLVIQLLAVLALWVAGFRPLWRRTITALGRLDTARRRLTRSNRKLARRSRALQEAQQRLQAIVNAAGEGICGLDAAGNITFCNPSGGRLLQQSPERLVGINFCSYLEPGAAVTDGPRADCPLCQAVRRGNAYRSEAHTLHPPGGPVIPVRLVATPLSRQDRPLGAVLLFTDISERKEQERVARQRLQWLERSNRELDDFACTASHDLKEPLRGIHANTGFLLEDCAPLLDDRGRGYVERIRRLSGKLSLLIDTLLLYSRIGRSHVTRQPVDLNTLIEEVRDSLWARLQDRSIHLVVPEPLPTIDGNRILIGELLHNLIDNAIKYNHDAEKRIEIGCSETTPRLFHVRDNGIGIPEAQQRAIFKLFARLPDPGQEYEGIGAGLAIARKIVEQHGGRIWVESVPGRGSTFYFTLQGLGHAGRRDDDAWPAPIPSADRQRGG